MKTWSVIAIDQTVDSIEHPLTGVLMPKCEFQSEFHLLLSELDGTTASDYFDFYFEKCPIIRTAYRFRDDDSKEDFIDACIELGLLPTFKETLQGENKEEKLRREHKSSEDLLQDFKSLKSKEMTKKYHSDPLSRPEEKAKYRSKAQQIQHTYDKLVKELETVVEPERKKKVEEKLNRVLALMEHSM